MSRASRLQTIITALVILGLTLAACGGAGQSTSQSQEPSTQPEGSGGSSAAPSAAGGLPDLEAAQAVVDEYMAVPAFNPPGPAFDTSGLAGMTIFDIPLNSTIPTAQLKQTTYRQILDEIGVNLIIHENQGGVNDYAAGMNAAISQAVDLIILDGAPNPELLGPQIQQATDAGIPVLVTHFFDEEEEWPEGFSLVPAPFNLSGKLEANWITVDSGGDANVLVIQAAEANPSEGLVGTIENEFAAVCGDGCGVTVINVPVNEWSSKVQGEVQSALIRDPEINYVLPLYDFGVPFANAGVVAAGRDDVKIVSFNGTPSVLKMIQDETAVVMNAGENPQWLAYANMDQALRILAGEEPVESENTPLRIFDASNVEQAGVPPALGTGYGDEYVTGYRELWGLDD